jgi:hypothetical protein
MAKGELKRMKMNVDKLKDQINIVNRENEFMTSMIEYTKKFN